MTNHNIRPRQHEELLCIAVMGEVNLLSPLNARIIHIPNGGARGKDSQSGKIIGGKLKKMGAVAGVPDYLILFHDGSFAFLEAKLELKKLGNTVIHRRTDLSDVQKVFHKDMLALCAGELRYEVFRTVEEFVGQLSRWGVLWRRRRRTALPTKSSNKIREEK